MKLTKITQVKEFLAIADNCEGDVWLVSLQGDKYNLKSTLTQYVAMGALLGEKGDELELFCDLPEDEQKFLKWFNENPEVLQP